MEELEVGLGYSSLDEGQKFLADSLAGIKSQGEYPLIFKDTKVEGLDPFTGKYIKFTTSVPNPAASGILRGYHEDLKTYRLAKIQEAKEKSLPIIILREAVPNNNTPTSRLRTSVKTTRNCKEAGIDSSELFIVKEHSDINPHSVVVVMVGGVDEKMWLVKDYESGEIFPIDRNFLRNINEPEGKVISRGAFRLLRSMFGSEGSKRKK